jgi:hypothetical protein
MLSWNLFFPFYLLPLRVGLYDAMHSTYWTWGRRFTINRTIQYKFSLGFLQ